MVGIAHHSIAKELKMETVKWHGINRPGDDLVVCIRGAYWDVTRHDVTGDWMVRTPDGSLTGKHRTRELARISAEETMKKWGVI